MAQARVLGAINIHGKTLRASESEAWCASTISVCLHVPQTAAPAPPSVQAPLLPVAPMVGAPHELTHGAIETPVFTISTFACFYGVRHDLVPPVPYGTKVKESQDLEQTGPRLRLRMSRVERSEDPADDGDQATAPSLTFAATFLDCIRPKQPKLGCAFRSYSSGSRFLRASVV